MEVTSSDLSSFIRNEFGFFISENLTHIPGSTDHYSLHMGRLRGIDWTHPQGRAVFWHSTAHVLGYALQRQFPGIQLADGPPVRDSTDTHALHGGFFYEGTLVGGHRIVHEDLP